MKKQVWLHIYRLIKPHRKKFLLAVFITLLSTGATLVEPLVYREAINDIAGLFVEQAKEDVRNENILAEESSPAVENTVTADSTDTEDNTAEADSTAVDDSTASEIYNTTAGDNAAKKDSTPVSNLAETKIAAPEKTIVKPPHIKHPHSKTHVAGRTPEEAIETLGWAVLILFIVNIIGYILWLIGDNMHVRLSCLIEQRFIQGAFAHVLRLPLAFFSKRSPSAISKQIDQSEEVSGIVNALAQEILPEIIGLFGILAIMFWQNPELTLVSIAVIPLYLLIAWRSSKKLETGLDTYYERWEEVSGRIVGALTGIKTVKLSGAEAGEVNNYQKISAEAYKNYVDRALLSNKFTFWQGILTNISTALVLGYGGYLALLHKITPGDVVMFVTYLDRLYSPIDALSSLGVNLQQHVASISRAFRLLDNNIEEKPGKELKLTKGLIEFKNVHFGYTPEREVLKGLNIRFESGKITAIVGGSGAGKTTAVDLILKLYEPQSGEILVDGTLLSTIDPSSIRSQIGMVSADAAIFGGTLANNIRYKKQDATDEEVMKAAESAGLKNAIARLPEGLNTIIGQNGMGLSVGERQRVNIARVLLSETKILILDEATANLDYNTEAQIKSAIEQLRSKSTIIIIAHRYSMVHDADHVIVLGEGTILESGTPAELIKKKGWFADFANATETENSEEETEEETEEEAEEESEEEADED